jgi:hypothetical protein
MSGVKPSAPTQVGSAGVRVFVGVSTQWLGFDPDTR